MARSTLKKWLNDRLRIHHHYNVARTAAHLVRRWCQSRARLTQRDRNIAALLNRILATHSWASSGRRDAYRLTEFQGPLRPKCNTCQRFVSNDVTIAIKASIPRCSGLSLEFNRWTCSFTLTSLVMNFRDQDIVACKPRSGAGIVGSNLRNMILKTVEEDLAFHPTAHAARWLPGKAMPNIANKTRRLSAEHNLLFCFPHIAIPRSTAVSEPFAGGFNHQHLWSISTTIPDTHTVRDRIGGWFAHFKEDLPCSGLRMRSPREFRENLSPPQGVHSQWGNLNYGRRRKDHQNLHSDPWTPDRRSSKGTGRARNRQRDWHQPGNTIARGARIHAGFGNLHQDLPLAQCESRNRSGFQTAVNPTCKGQRALQEGPYNSA